MPTNTLADTLLEVTPQPTEIDVSTSIELDILTDADTISTDTDNQNVSINVKSSHEDATNPDLTHFIADVTGDNLGDTHIEISATATNKNKAIVEWDIEVIDTQVPPTTTPPTTTPPTFDYPLKVEIGKRYINEKFNIVVPLKEYPQQRLRSGAFVNIFKCRIYSKDFSSDIGYFTDEGKRVDREFTYSDFAFINNGSIIEYDNQYIEVLKDFISYADWAVVDSVDNTGKIINLSKNAVQTIELNDKDFHIVINNDLKLATLNEVKFKQVCNFLGVINVFA